MDILDLIKKRRSIRKFKNIPILNKDIIDLIESGIYAPSGSNTQCYRFIIIENKEDIKFLAKSKLWTIANAPLVIMVVANLLGCPYLYGKRSSEFDKLPYQDCAMAMQNICLVAESKKLGSCVIHLSKNISNAIEIQKHFKLEPYHELMGLVLIGYPDEVVDYKTVTHAGRPIKRNEIADYILEWR